MAFPLYTGVSIPTDLTAANKSLIFDKFYDWKNLGGELKDQDKTHNLKKLISGGCGEKAAIDAQVESMIEIVEALGGQWTVFKNSWHFITGMGNNHPLENGMAWHHTLGSPYLAGSGVKGLVRAFCEEWASWEKEKVERCFGKAADKTSQGNAGDYIFFDAIPTKRPTLTPDVMTPHMGKWYEKGDEDRHTFENTPGDWHAPVPVTFLAVKDISLFFGVAPRPGRGSAGELAELMQALSDALEWVGAGAKTASGYGHFEVDEVTLGSFRSRQESKSQEQITHYVSRFEAENSVQTECLNEIVQQAVITRKNEDYDTARAEHENLKKTLETFDVFLNGFKVKVKVFAEIERKAAESFIDILMEKRNYAVEEIEKLEKHLKYLEGKRPKTAKQAATLDELASCDNLKDGARVIKNYIGGKGGRFDEDDKHIITEFFIEKIVLIESSKKRKRESKDYKKWVDAEIYEKFIG